MENVSNTQTFLKWHKQDTIWMLSLYGTAIGAGTLFLPIAAGLNGIWPLLAMLLLSFPMTYFAHRALCQFILSGTANKGITEVVNEHFGQRAGNLITICYFLAIFPILLMYSVAITNTCESFILHQLRLIPPPRTILALILVFFLTLIAHFGKQFITKIMSLLVYPFIFALIFLSIYLIPNWNLSIFHQGLDFHTSKVDLLLAIWLLLPVIIFSFNHSPIISSFTISQKEYYGVNAEKKCLSILKYSHLMMVGTVLLFVFSCVLSLSPQDLILAKQQNISILSYLANHFHTSLIANLAPIIAFIAIAKSFLGHYLGAKEGLESLLARFLNKSSFQLQDKTLNWLIEWMMVITCWVVATLNPSILSLIERVSGPIIAIILFLMPLYAIAKAPELVKYKSDLVSNIFLFMIGFISLSAIFISFFLK